MPFVIWISVKNCLLTRASVSPLVGFSWLYSPISSLALVSIYGLKRKQHFFLIFWLLFLKGFFFHHCLDPLRPPPHSNHHTLVHVPESFVLFAPSLHTLASPTPLSCQPVLWVSVCLSSSLSSLSLPSFSISLNPHLSTNLTPLRSLHRDMQYLLRAMSSSLPFNLRIPRLCKFLLIHKPLANHRS